MRQLLRPRLEEAAPRCERFTAVIAGGGVRLQPGQRAQVTLDPVGLRLVGDDSVRRATKLLTCLMPACAFTISPRAQYVMPSP